MTRIQPDQPGSLLFPADNQVWALPWVNNQNVFDPFVVKILRNDAQWHCNTGFKLPIKKNRLQIFFLIGYELSPHKDG